MSDAPDPLTGLRGDLHLLARDLGCISGTLTEIATVWRRARQYRPDLPLGLPLRLEAAARQLTAITDDLAWAGPSQRPPLALLLTGQMSALERDAAAAEAMTCGADIPPVGDAGLWKYLGAAMQQARAREVSIILQLPKVRTVPVSDQAAQWTSVLPQQDARLCPGRSKCRIVKTGGGEQGAREPSPRGHGTGGAR